MPSQVYLVRVADWKDLEVVAGRFSALLHQAPLLDSIRERDLTAIKLTFGEAGNEGYPPPRLVRELADAVRGRGARPFLTETNTLYNGRRKNSVDHLEIAREHGFTHESIGALIILGDGLLGREGLDVNVDGKWIRTAHLVPTVRDMGFLIGLAHLTGHLLCGFGGAIKNIGMGLANRAGKLDMHSVVSPTVKKETCTLCLRCQEACAAGAISHDETSAVINSHLCTGCADCIAVCPTGAVSIDWFMDSPRVQERMAEYAQAVVHALDGRIVFINFLNMITKHCDCLAEPPERIAPDIGIAASHDPVALDQAGLDLVAEAVGGDPFGKAWPETDPEAQIRHAEEIGLGERAYDLVEIPFQRP
jgi:uncharacterized Fe-S center protein